MDNWAEGLDDWMGELPQPDQVERISEQFTLHHFPDGLVFEPCPICGGEPGNEWLYDCPNHLLLYRVVLYDSELKERFPFTSRKMALHHVDEGDFP